MSRSRSVGWRPCSSLIAFCLKAPIVVALICRVVNATRTGNPLVDSVAEHQAASEQAYDMLLGACTDVIRHREDKHGHVQKPLVMNISALGIIRP